MIENMISGSAAEAMGVGMESYELLASAVMSLSNNSDKTDTVRKKPAKTPKGTKPNPPKKSRN